jgi:hypothetical protein
VTVQRTKPEARHPVLFPPASDFARAITFEGAGGGDVPRDPAAWAAELPTVLARRLEGLALEAARRESIDLAPDVLAALRAAHLTNIAISMKLEGKAPEVAAHLDRAGVPSVLIKGPGIAACYDSRELRPFIDIDLIVSPKRFNAAIAALGRIGFRAAEVFLPPREFFHRYCREAITLERDDGIVVDLHHHVSPWIWGRMLSFDAIFAESSVEQIGNGTARVAAPAHNLLIAALHIVRDRGRRGYELLMWRDVVQLASRVDARAAAAEAAKRGLDWCVLEVLNAIPEDARPAELARALRGAGVARPGGLDGLITDADAAQGRDLMRARLKRLPAANRLAFVAGYAVPSREFLRQNVGSPWGYGKWIRRALGRAGDATQWG